MTYASFRTSYKRYTQRPSSNCKSARYVWDFLIVRGEIKSMGLLDGLWICERIDGSTDEIEASLVLYETLNKSC